MTPLLVILQSIKLGTSDGGKASLRTIQSITQARLKGLVFHPILHFSFTFQANRQIAMEKLCSPCVEVLFYVSAGPDKGTMHLWFFKKHK